MARTLEFPPSPEPHTIEVELTNRCNARCAFCPHPQMERAKGLMDLGRFTAFLDDLDTARAGWWLNRRAGALRFPRITFAGLGEPLLHPDAEAFVAACTARNFATLLVSNAIALDGERARGLAAAGLGTLAISLHTLDANVYRALVGPHLRKVLPRVEQALRALAGTATRVELWRVLPPPDMAQPQDDARAFAALLERHPNATMIGPSQPWERDGTVAGSVHGPANDYPEAGIPCALAYFTANLAWNGDGVLCCVDYHRRSVDLGNLFDEGIAAGLARRAAFLAAPAPPVCLACRKWPDRQYDALYDEMGLGRDASETL